MIFFVVAAIGCAPVTERVVADLLPVRDGRRRRARPAGGDGLPGRVLLDSAARATGRSGSTPGRRPGMRRPASAMSWSLIAFLALPESGQPLLWRIVVGFGAVPALVVLLVRRRFLKESPQWLANQGDLRGAVDILRSAYGIDAELAPDAVATRRAKPVTWSAFGRLWSPLYRTRTIAALCVSVFSTFGYNAVAYGTPFDHLHPVPAGSVDHDRGVAGDQSRLRGGWRSGRCGAGQPGRLPSVGLDRVRPASCGVADLGLVRHPVRPAGGGRGADARRVHLRPGRRARCSADVVRDAELSGQPARHRGRLQRGREAGVLHRVAVLLPDPGRFVGHRRVLGDRDLPAARRAGPGVAALGSQRGGHRRRGVRGRAGSHPCDRADQGAGDLP